ncbi:HIT family protein [Photorhabdus stackebrandtii]|nr:HIT domain-containing protein [Photorhabdus stackebrandtii]
MTRAILLFTLPSLGSIGHCFGIKFIFISLSMISGIYTIIASVLVFISLNKKTYTRKAFNNIRILYMSNCIFCEIITRKSPAHVIWEDNDYIAFLSIYPNTPGVTVVIPKKHYGSYAFELSDDNLSGLIIASKRGSDQLPGHYP